MNRIVAHTDLRRGLWADVAVTSLAAALQLVGGASLATALSLPAALVLATGLFVPIYVACLLWLAGRPLGQRRPVPSWCVAVVVYGNMVWAAMCVAIAALGVVAPNAWGWAYLLLQAAAVMGLALWQRHGWRLSQPFALQDPAQTAYAK
jgi:hypothetical protein